MKKVWLLQVHFFINFQGSLDGTIKYWTGFIFFNNKIVEDGNEVFEIKNQGRNCCIAVLDDGETFISGSDNK
jgi:hypothetical protein